MSETARIAQLVTSQEADLEWQQDFYEDLHRHRSAPPATSALNSPILTAR